MSVKFLVEKFVDYLQDKQEQALNAKAEARAKADQQKQAQARSRIMRAVTNEHTPQSRASIFAKAGIPRTMFDFVFGDMQRDQTLLIRPYRDNLNRLQSTGFILRDYANAYDAKGDAC